MGLFDKKKKNAPVSGEAYEDVRVAENCKKVTLDSGTVLPYCEFGEENEEVIVTGAVYFITFNEYLKALAKKYHVYGFIMRIGEDGTETEKNPDGSVNWTRQWGKEVYEATQKLGLSQFHFVGKCHGVMPGWYMAAEHPEVLSSIVSISSSLHCAPRDDSQWSKRQKEDGPKFALAMMNKKANLVKKAAEAKTVGNTGFQGEGALAAMAKYGEESEQVFYGDYEKCKELLGKIKFPICYIFAQNDLLYYDWKTAHEYAMYHSAGKYKFVMLGGEVHLMEMDMPVKLASETLYFLEQTKMKYE